MTYIVCGDSFCVNGIHTSYVTRYGHQVPWYDEHHFASLLPDTISYGQGSASNLQIARQFFQAVKRHKQIDGIYIQFTTGGRVTTAKKSVDQMMQESINLDDNTDIQMFNLENFQHHNSVDIKGAEWYFKNYDDTRDSQECISSQLSVLHNCKLLGLNYCWSWGRSPEWNDYLDVMGMHNAFEMHTDRLLEWDMTDYGSRNGNMNDFDDWPPHHVADHDWHDRMAKQVLAYWNKFS